MFIYLSYSYGFSFFWCSPSNWYGTCRWYIYSNNYFNNIGIGLVGLGAFVSDPIQWVEWLKGHGILLWCTKFLTSYCVLYHFAGGLRHMYFEYFPEQLTFKSIISSSWVLYLGTAVVCIGLASWTLKPKAKKAIKA